MSAILEPRTLDRAQLDGLRDRLPEYLGNLGHELKRQGARLLCDCPLHADNSPSFAVLPNGRTAGCYPCDWQGDVFALSLAMGRASTFPEAVNDVASVLDTTLAEVARIAPRKPRPAPKPAELSDGQRKQIHLARLRFSDAFHAGEPIVDEIAASLGITREALRWASHGSDGLAIAKGWLCYAYAGGLKYRNPDSTAKPRFKWLVGTAAAPWRMAWARRPEVETVFLMEGESDALAMLAAGIESADPSVAVVASPGSGFQGRWAPLFAGKNVVLCFDDGEAGRIATATVAATLKGHAHSIRRWKGAISK